MEVIIEDQKWHVDETISEVEVLFERIHKLLDERKLHISHMVIDDVEVYDDYQNFIVQQLPDINSIHIELVTLEQFTTELVSTAYSYCVQAAKLLPELSAQYYQTPTKDSWEQFQDFLEGVSWLTRLVDMFAEMEAMQEQWPLFAETRGSLNNMMTELLQSMERNDHTGIGDLLQYEVLPQIEQLRQALAQYIGEEGA